VVLPKHFRRLHSASLRLAFTPDCSIQGLNVPLMFAEPQTLPHSLEWHSRTETLWARTDSRLPSVESPACRMKRFAVDLRLRSAAVHHQDSSRFLISIMEFILPAPGPRNRRRPAEGARRRRRAGGERAGRASQEPRGE